MRVFGSLVHIYLLFSFTIPESDKENRVGPTPDSTLCVS